MGIYDTLNEQQQEAVFVRRDRFCFLLVQGLERLVC